MIRLPSYITQNHAQRIFRLHTRTTVAAEKLTAARLIEKFHTLQGTRSFIAVFTKADMSLRPELHDFTSRPDIY